jgi:hypothetical protein
MDVSAMMIYRQHQSMTVKPYQSHQHNFHTDGQFLLVQGEQLLSILQ